MPELPAALGAVARGGRLRPAPEHMAALVVSRHDILRSPVVVPLLLRLPAGLLVREPACSPVVACASLKGVA